jgi:hypothetical protein
MKTALVLSTATSDSTTTLQRKEATTIRARLWMKPSAASWRIPASTIG